MSAELLDELEERLVELGVDQDEAAEILQQLQESAYAEGYDQGVADTRQEGADPEGEESEPLDPWAGGETLEES